MNQCSLAYSQTKINVHPNDDEKRMNFTGKEKDSESGYHYFGARYYDSEALSGWLSVDPMSDKYPSMSPYNYCAWNPVRLVDPDGEVVRNAYLQYKDIREDIAYYQERMKNDPHARKQYRNAIRELELNHKQYVKTQEAIDAFKDANIEEYNIINNLNFEGKNVDVIVGANLSRRFGRNGAVGETRPRFIVKDEKVVGFTNQSDNSIFVTLYADAFLGGTHGLGTIANEFGDVLFSVLRPDYAYEQGLKCMRKEHSYAEDPSANFSYDYEFYICNPERHKKPNPYEY